MNFETSRRIRNISITHHIVRKNKFETPFVLQREACGAGSGWSRDDGFCGFPSLGLRRGARCAAYCFQLGLHTWSVAIKQYHFSNMSLWFIMYINMCVGCNVLILKIRNQCLHRRCAQPSWIRLIAPCQQGNVEGSSLGCINQSKKKIGVVWAPQNIREKMDIRKMEKEKSCDCIWQRFQAQDICTGPAHRNRSLVVVRVSPQLDISFWWELGSEVYNVISPM